jgi:ketosteroid isomerase-like protein
VEIMRSIYAAVVVGDLDPFVSMLDETAEYVNPADALESGVRRGREEFEAAIRQLLESFDYSRITVERLLAVGDDVVAVVDVEGRGQDSGAPFRMRFGHVITFRRGRIQRFQWFLDPEEALAAVGLRE